MLRCNVGDQLLDQHRLSDTGTAKQTNLTALGVGCQKINDFDAGLQHLRHRALVLKRRRIPVDHPFLFSFQAFTSINGLA